LKRGERNDGCFSANRKCKLSDAIQRDIATQVAEQEEGGGKASDASNKLSKTKHEIL